MWLDFSEVFSMWLGFSVVRDFFHVVRFFRFFCG